LTSPAVQQQLGVDRPDFGALFDDMLLHDGGTVPYRAVLQPRAEAEVALVLGRSIEDPDVTVEQLAASIDHLLPAIEIVGSRIEGWDISIVDTVADNASSGMFVLGTTPVDPASVDLAKVTMVMTLDGESVSEGTGAACLGHPYNAALWLAKRMITEGTPPRAGDTTRLGPTRVTGDRRADGPAVAAGPERPPAGPATRSYGRRLPPADAPWSVVMRPRVVMTRPCTTGSKWIRREWRG
jgi:2-keto-4-pentenoate hydratase